MAEHPVLHTNGRAYTSREVLARVGLGGVNLRGAP